ncbi:MAG: MBL fold metallo-hydrolase [Flavitalea sp.]
MSDTNTKTRTQRIVNSKQFRNGEFVNISPTSMKADDVSYAKLAIRAAKRPSDSRPSKPLPSIKTDLKNINDDNPVIIWFGHSSYLIRYRGKNILVDPVFSGHASPVSFMVKAFPGANTYGVDDMPVIDVLLITHDHYDHLDTHTIKSLKSKTKSIVTSLGVGAFLETLVPGVPITELDWWESFSLEDVHFTACPARHFSGRTLRRNRTLWSSFVIQYPGYSIYAGGDSGYDHFFKQIGQKYGPFDLAILECGQYNEMWPQIHMMPEETAKAAKDLNAKYLLPVHWGKFALSVHSWMEPVKRVKIAADELHLKITTPRFGEKIILNEIYPDKTWWLEA